MQLRLDALEGHLKQASTKGLAPLYVVHGDEHLLVLEAVDALRQAGVRRFEMPATPARVWKAIREAGR